MEQVKDKNDDRKEEGQKPDKLLLIQRKKVIAGDQDKYIVGKIAAIRNDESENDLPGCLIIGKGLLRYDDSMRAEVVCNDHYDGQNAQQFDGGISWFFIDSVHN